MKSKVWILCVFVIFFAACRNDDQLSFEEEFTSEVENNQDESQGENQNLDGEEGALSLYQVQGDQISKIKDYTVSQDLLPFQKDYAKHFAMWDFVVQLLPAEERSKVVEFEVFHGGGQLSGYVVPINENDLSKWRMGLAIDEAEDLENVNLADFFTYVTIHEYGHILTLNNDQVDADNQNNCSSYFTGEGCSHEQSYINQIYELGWKDIIDEMDDNDPDAFYEKYKDRFVTDYAATNPGEDIAEVFATFVTQADQPRGNSIADQKIKLLYDFPELTQLRDKIRQNANPATLLRSNWRSDLRFSKMRICGHKGCKHRKQ